MQAAIVYLTRKERIHKLTHSLRLLQQNLLAKHSYPVILFHEGDFTPADGDQLRKICPTLSLRRVNINPPAHIDGSKRREWNMYPRFNVGYRNMCRFFTIGLYEYLEEFDYYMRLDDDSFITSEVPFDPFQFMADNDKRYAWRAMHSEPQSAIVGLVKCLQDYDDKFFDGRTLSRVYYTNFHVAQTKIFTESPIKDALEYVDMNGGIYTGRWGDHAIHTLVLNAYLEPKHRHHFTEFQYTHGKHTYKIGH